MEKVIIFGVNDFAELAHYYLTTDTKFQVEAFCVDSAYIPKSGFFLGLPVVDFKNVAMLYPASDYKFFAPLAPTGMNFVRKQIYYLIKEMGYSFVSYISSRCTVFNTEIGENCFILEDNTIQPFVKIGNNIVLWSGNHIGHHSVICDNTMITSHVVVSGHCHIGSQSFIGVNSTLRDGLRISEGTFIAMSSSITRDTDAWCAYRGNPGSKYSDDSRSIKF